MRFLTLPRELELGLLAAGLGLLVPTSIFFYYMALRVVFLAFFVGNQLTHQFPDLAGGVDLKSTAIIAGYIFVLSSIGTLGASLSWLTAQRGYHLLQQGSAQGEGSILMSHFNARIQILLLLVIFALTFWPVASGFFLPPDLSLGL